MSLIHDTLGRPLQDLRISVTDRCNFRCGYCMPAEIFGKKYPFLPKSEILTFEEIVQVVQLFAEQGVRKLRLTGGEPLLRRDLAELIRLLTDIPKIEDIALTTNGVGLAEVAPGLIDAGLQRVTVSLDSLDEATFKAMCGCSASMLESALAGLEVASIAGLGVKINMVVQRNLNEDDILPIARLGKSLGTPVRFIEFMDVGNHNCWKQEKVVPVAEILERLEDEFEFESIEPAFRGEVAKRHREVGGEWEVGLISSITQPFCRDCVRARLTSDGRLFTCLFATQGTDLKGPLRTGGDEALLDTIVHAWTGRDDQYSELRSNEGGNVAEPRKVEMSYVGG